MTSTAPARTELETARAQTRAVYQTEAEGFDRHRPRLGFESAYLERLCARMSSQGSVLDLGCGTGDPVSAYFIERGYAVTGLDYSDAMLAIARKRFPGARWLAGDMRELALNERFESVVSWDGSFHLTKDEQRALIPVIADHLQPGGSLTLTIGHRDDEVLGVVEGRHVYHASLSPREYEQRLLAAGFAEIRVTLEDAACDRHSIVEARLT